MYPREPAPCIVYLDTNVLLDLPDLRAYRTSYPDLTLVILPEVLGELAGLARGRGAEGQPARRAQLELQHLESMRGVALGIPVPGGTALLEIPDRHGIPNLSVDDALVRAAQARQQQEPRAVVGLFTRDGRIADRALYSGLPCPLPRFKRVTPRAAEDALRHIVAGISGL